MNTEAGCPTFTGTGWTRPRPEALTQEPQERQVVVPLGDREERSASPSTDGLRAQEALGRDETREPGVQAVVRRGGGDIGQRLRLAGAVAEARQAPDLLEP